MEPFPSQSVPIDTLSGFSPMQAVAGLSCRLARGNIVSADTIWKKWSRFKMYFLMDPDPRFSDTFQERVGLEQRFFPEADWLESFAMRAGWYYEPSPTPNQDGVWNILDNDKHVFSTGFGLRIDRVLGIIKTPINLDGHFQLHYLIPQTIDNDDDPAYPEIKTGGFVYVGSGTIEIAW
jgi:long-chain fatty acid transport protein